MYNRLGIYVTYDKNGIIDDYIPFFLSEIKKAVDCLVVVSNHDLAETEAAKLTMADAVFIRDNRGYDVCAWADALNDFIGWDKIQQYKEVVFMNDSYFGPFYPFQELFVKMDEDTSLDFWGITKRAVSNFDGGEIVYPEHIQSYFFAVRERMLQSPHFVEFWENISSKISNFRSAIINFEFTFTKYFSDLGFHWDVYAAMPEYDTEELEYNLSPYHYDNYALIKDKRCPVLKRKQFTGDFVDVRYSDKSDLIRTFRYIQSNTSYDCSMIWEHILRIYKLQDLLEGMNLIQVVDRDTPYSYCNDNTEKYGKIVLENGKLLGNGTTEITSVDDIRKKKYTLFINQTYTKEKPVSLMQAEEYCIFENLAADTSYMNEVVKIFEKNPLLGIVVPPMLIAGKFTEALMSKWTDSGQAKRLYELLNLTVPVDFENAPIHAINAFWCRSELVDENVLNLLRGDDTDVMMQLIPLVAQQKGYYTEVVQSSYYAPVYMTNIKRYLHTMLETCDVDSRLDMQEVVDAIKGEKLKDFCQKHEKVYIYGAGQLACRAAGVIGKWKMIEGFLVSDGADNPDCLLNIPVKVLSDMEETDLAAGIIVAVGKRHNDDVLQMLHAEGINNIFIY